MFVKLEDILPSRGLGSGLAAATDVVLAMVIVETAILNVVVSAAGAELVSEIDSARFTSSRRSNSSRDRSTHFPCTIVGTLVSIANVSAGSGGSGDKAATLQVRQASSSSRLVVHCNRGLWRCDVVWLVERGGEREFEESETRGMVDAIYDTTVVGLWCVKHHFFRGGIRRKRAALESICWAR
jgi:hypothetical protein